MKKRGTSQLVNKRKSIWKDNASWQLLMLCLPAIIGYLLYYYVPIATSIVIPFKDYKFAKGILGSEWVGFKNFEWIFASTTLGRSIRNTLLYGIWFMIACPVANMIIALLLFEITNRKALKTYQTVISFPNFMSMVVVGYITYAILSPTNGALNQVLEFLGKERIDVYMNEKYWPGILTIVRIWKGIGMGSLMYFAALMGIDSSLYEAAELDGANRFQRLIHISLPHLIPLLCIFTILNAGGLVKSDFDLFYIIPRNSRMLYETTDVLNTYQYRALQEGTYSMGATIGLLQSVVGMALVVVANWIVKKISPENSMF